MNTGDRVRLVRSSEELPAGSEGTVLGFFRSLVDPRVLVEFSAAGGREPIRAVPEQDVEAVSAQPAGELAAGDGASAHG